MGGEEASVARVVPWDRVWEELCGYDRALNFLTVVVASLGAMTLCLNFLVPVQFMFTAMLLIAALVVASLFSGLKAQFRLANAINAMLGGEHNWTLPDGATARFNTVDNCRLVFDTETGVQVFRPREIEKIVGLLSLQEKAN